MIENVLSMLLLVVVILVFAAIFMLLWIGFWHSAKYSWKEWRRAYKQAKRVERIALDLKNDDVPTMERIRSRISFMFNDFGQIYRTIDIVDPVTGKKTLVDYNGTLPS